uniref:Uncharacterized protein LOC111116743 n=1 Tax=Crassostrea virginica TaxID=6565 RepID=A0A8B8C6T4_CRAVI|nr:uncharacterized protein LOC111116743 [Crassostrea virginica]
MAETCPTSAASVSIIDNCPMNSSEWNQRATQKNCSMYPQTCNKPLQYHCLLNTYGNESIEVCAPDTLLNNDFCPSFNINQQRILEQFNCTSLIADCPERPYNSTSILNYKGCMKQLYGSMMPSTDSTLTTVENHPPNCPAMSGTSLWPTFLIISVLIILIMLAALFILHRWKKRKRGKYN